MPTRSGGGGLRPTRPKKKKGANIAETFKRPLQNQDKNFLKKIQKKKKKYLKKKITCRPKSNKVQNGCCRKNKK
ncbi:hypothetical protein ACVGXP_00185, partial [Enterobacter hormaechei]